MSSKKFTGELISPAICLLVDELFDKHLSRDSKEGEMLQVALLLIKQYEDTQYPVPICIYTGVV